MGNVNSNIKLTEIEGPFGDCTSIYNVSLFKELTVAEFIDEVLNYADTWWGTINFINNPNCSDPVHLPFLEQIPVVEYRNKDIKRTNKKLFDEIRDKTVKLVKSHGGYTAMDYYFTLHEKI